MVVEVYMKSTMSESNEGLPDSIHELEMMKEEIEHTMSKLQESTDILIDEFRSTDGEEAREYFEYVQDNLAVLKDKAARVDDIQNKIDSIRCVFPKRKNEDNGGDSNSQGAQGHFI